MLAWCSWFLILKSQRYTEHWPTEMTDRLSHIVCQFIGHFPVHHFWIITLIFFHFWSFKWRKSWFFFKWILILNYLSVFKDCMKGCLCFFLNQVRIRWPWFFWSSLNMPLHCSELAAIKSNSISTGNWRTVHMELLLQSMTPLKTSEGSLRFAGWKYKLSLT